MSPGQLAVAARLQDDARLLGRFQAGDDLAELSPEAIIVFGLDGAIQFWNASAQRLYGWDRSDALRKPIGLLLSPHSADSLAEAQERIRRDGRWAGAVRRTTASGNDVAVHLRWILRFDQEGQPASVVEFSEAATPAAGIPGQEQRYRRLFQRAPVALMLTDAPGIRDLMRGLRTAGVTDLDTHIDAHPEFLEQALDAITVAEVNGQAMRLLGAADAAELMLPIRRIWIGDRGTFRRSLVARFSGEPHFAEETQVRAVDGRTIEVLLSMAFPPRDEFRVASMMGLVDITARREAETQLQKVSADFAHAAKLSTLGELTTSIAHEVKQPLSAILTNAQTARRWLSRDQPNVEKAAQLAARVAESAQRAGDIIDRIQDMAVQRQPALASLDLNEVVREALLFVRHEFEGKSVTVQSALATRLPPVRGDRIQLQQIIVNLLVNSVQAMALAAAPQRDIVIRTGTDDRDGVFVTVRDTGPGIPAEHLGQVFDGFFTTKSDGMGIGLAICHSIVTAHGGTITVSNHPDRGAIFRVAIPRAGVAATASDPRARRPSERRPA